MPWFWGGNNQQAQQQHFANPADPNGTTAGQQTGDVQLTKAEKKAMEAYRFDSSALERAAAAAKTLESSSEYTAI